MKKKLLLFMLLLTVTAGIVFGHLNGQSMPLEKIGYALDTQIRIVVYDKGVKKEILDNAYNEILRLDKLLSNFDNSAETARLNKEKSLDASDELKSIIEAGIKVTKETGGSYDLTVYPLSELWNYKNERVPSEKEINDALKKINIENIEISGNAVALKNDAQIDVSSIAKGYIADYVIKYLKDNNITNALVDAGGNIKVIGSPDKKKDYFNIGVKNPKSDGSVSMGVIKLSDKSIVTSGIYERGFESEGKTYHHIIDTKTGYPSESDVVSASIISESSVMADAYATAVVVMGSEKGLEFIEKTDDTECVIITKDNKVIVSCGLEDFKITNEAYKY